MIILYNVDKATVEELKKKFSPLLLRLKRSLSVFINDAKISRQLSSSPCAVIASGQALDAASEKLLKSQKAAKNDPMIDFYLRQKYTFEINPNHPIILELLDKAEDKSDLIEDTIHVLFESTVISSGFSVRNPKKFGQKIQTVIKKSLGIVPKIDAEYNAGYADGSENIEAPHHLQDLADEAIDGVFGAEEQSDESDESDDSVGSDKSVGSGESVGSVAPKETLDSMGDAHVEL